MRFCSSSEQMLLAGYLELHSVTNGIIQTPLALCWAGCWDCRALVAMVITMLNTFRGKKTDNIKEKQTQFCAKIKVLSVEVFLTTG